MRTPCARCGQHAAARRGGPAGTGNHYSSPFHSFFAKPKPKASLPSSTGTSTAQLSTREGGSLPHRFWVSLFYERLLLQLLCASSAAQAPSAGGRAKVDNQGRPGWTAREDSAPLGPLVPSHGESFARFAVPECFLGFEMSNISAILSKEYKACNHSNFFKSLKGNKLYICIHTTCIHVLCILSHMCTYLHPHLQDHSHSIFLFLGKHPAIFNRNGLLLEVHNVMGQRLERMLSVQIIRFFSNATDFKFHLNSC